jgi:ketosteroid isomerase-like protein
MTRLIWIGTMLVLGMSWQALGAPADEEVRAAEKEWAAAVVARDFTKLEQVLGAKLIYAHSTGAVEGKQEYLKRLHSGAQKYDAIEFEKTAVNFYGDTAVAHSHLTMRGVSNGAPFDHKLMMMHLWVKAGGGWQLAAHQTTRLP